MILLMTFLINYAVANSTAFVDSWLRLQVLGSPDTVDSPSPG